jgi:hypothetical protein
MPSPLAYLPGNPPTLALKPVPLCNLGMVCIMQVMVR